MAKKTKKTKSFSISKLLKINLAVIITFLIPYTVYLIGFSYESGLLKAFGVQNDIFPKDFDHYFLQGFFKISEVLFLIPSNLKVFVIVPFLGLIYFILNFEKVDKIRIYFETLHSKSKEKANKSKAKDDNCEQNNNFTILDLFFESLGFIFLIPFFAFLTLVLIAIYLVAFHSLSMKYGSTIATEIKNNFNSNNGCEIGKTKPFNCVYIYNHNNKLTKKGTAISSQNDNMIIWDGENAILLNVSDRVVVFVKSEEGLVTSEIKD